MDKKTEVKLSGLSKIRHIESEEEPTIKALSSDLTSSCHHSLKEQSTPSIHLFSVFSLLY
jgi:hypothetical protein